MQITFTSYIGDDTPVTVECWLQPAERMTLEYPGCEAEVQVERVICNGQEVNVTDEDLERFEFRAWQEVEAYQQEREEYRAEQGR